MPASGRKFRLISLETAIFGFALFALGNGIVRNDLLSIFWGGLITLGLVALYFVRRKDWAKHWEEMERRHQNGRS